MGLFGLTGGAYAPVNHFRFINFIAETVFGKQAGGFAGAAFGIAHGTALSTDQMVMIVSSDFIARGGSSRLNPVHQPFIHHQIQGIVHRLT